MFFHEHPSARCRRLAAGLRGATSRGLSLGQTFSSICGCPRALAWMPSACISSGLRATWSSRKGTKAHGVLRGEVREHVRELLAVPRSVVMRNVRPDEHYTGLRGLAPEADGSSRDCRGWSLSGSPRRADSCAQFTITDPAGLCVASARG
jgi:hypothetical protein